MAQLNLPDDKYDAVISVGTFTCGHVGPKALDELIRITKPGGYICFTVRKEAWDEENYTDKTNYIEKQGAWKKVKVDTADYIKQDNSCCMICLYQIAG